MRQIALRVGVIASYLSEDFAVNFLGQRMMAALREEFLELAIRSNRFASIRSRVPGLIAHFDTLVSTASKSWGSMFAGAHRVIGSPGYPNNPIIETIYGRRFARPLRAIETWPMRSLARLRSSRLPWRSRNPCRRSHSPDPPTSPHYRFAARPNQDVR